MKLVCEICGRSNNRTKYKEEFDMILCDSCVIMCKKYKFHYIPPLGEIHYDDKGNIICHICGRSFKKLTEHIKFKHNMLELLAIKMTRFLLDSSNELSIHRL